MTSKRIVSVTEISLIDTVSYDIMGAMTMPNGFVRNKKYSHTTYTRYICSYDSGHKLLTVKSNTNLTVYQLGFEDIEKKIKDKLFS